MGWLWDTFPHCTVFLDVPSFSTLYSSPRNPPVFPSRCPLGFPSQVAFPAGEQRQSSSPRPKRGNRTEPDPPATGPASDRRERPEAEDNTARHGRAIASLSEQQRRGGAESLASGVVRGRGRGGSEGGGGRGLLGLVLTSVFGGENGRVKTKKKGRSLLFKRRVGVRSHSLTRARTGPLWAQLVYLGGESGPEWLGVSLPRKELDFSTWKQKE